MRRMFDSITAADIPADAAMVAGYVDGHFKWTDEEWAMFPNATRVRIWRWVEERIRARPAK